MIESWDGLGSSFLINTTPATLVFIMDGEHANAIDCLLLTHTHHQNSQLFCGGGGEEERKKRERERGRGREGREGCMYRQQKETCRSGKFS